MAKAEKKPLSKDELMDILQREALIGGMQAVADRVYNLLEEQRAKEAIVTAPGRQADIIIIPDDEGEFPIKEEGKENVTERAKRVL